MFESLEWGPPGLGNFPIQTFTANGSQLNSFMCNIKKTPLHSERWAVISLDDFCSNSFSSFY